MVAFGDSGGRWLSDIDLFNPVDGRRLFVEGRLPDILPEPASDTGLPSLHTNLALAGLLELRFKVILGFSRLSVTL